MKTKLIILIFLIGMYLLGKHIGGCTREVLDDDWKNRPRCIECYGILED